jgi:phosphonate degradation associated HDIG domain protein
MKVTVDGLIEMLAGCASEMYGGEAVTQLAHALQAAELAMRDGAEDALVCAALLHDVGHLLAKRPEGIDDRHEQIGAAMLAPIFIRAVTEPIRLHVLAKRYLCTVDPDYFATLSPASVRSLDLQGGLLGGTEAAGFAALAYAGDAVRLRRWDDLAKDPAAATQPLEAFVPLLRANAL